MSRRAEKGERFIVTEAGEKYIRQFNLDYPDDGRGIFCAGEVVVANQSDICPFVVRERDYGKSSVIDKWSLSVGEDLERI